MEMNFDTLQNLNATHGAFSIVTAREAGHDKSVTLDRYEIAVITKCHWDFCRRIGGVNIGEPKREFYIVNGGTSTLGELAIKYPKANKTELRLYMSRANKFYGKEGDVFFVYTVPDCPVPLIGFMTPMEWLKYENHHTSNV